MTIKSLIIQVSKLYVSTEHNLIFLAYLQNCLSNGEEIISEPVDSGEKSIKDVITQYLNVSGWLPSISGV